MPQRPTNQVILIYALGQLGWSLASYAVFNLLNYFYMPPETGEATFPPFIFQGAVLVYFTVIGLSSAGGRVFDAITDTLIAGWSDKTESSFGKRKKYMAIAAVPFALLSFLIFMPLQMEVTTSNTVWLVALLLLFYFFMTLYVVPYTALISELGHHPDDRLRISTAISIAWAVGFLIGSSVYALQDVFEQSMEPTAAFQLVVGIFAGIALLFMLIPVFFLKENKYTVQQPVAIDLMTSLRSVFQNHNFRFFLFSDLTYWLAITFIQVGVSFYITILLGMDKSFASLFSAIGFFASFALYAPVNIWAKRKGKKVVLSAAFLTFSAVFGLTALAGILPVPTKVLFYGLALLSAFPLAAFGILPNTIIADVVHSHQAKTGEQLSGMFYGTRNFMMKIGITLANLIFPSLLLLGNSMDNPTGVRMTTLAAMAFCLIGFFIFLKFRENPEHA